MSYFTHLVRLIIEYASIICNFLTSANAKKVERIQWKLKAPCYNRFFLHARCSYANVSEYVEPHTLRDRRIYQRTGVCWHVCILWQHV